MVKNGEDTRKRGGMSLPDEESHENII